MDAVNIQTMTKSRVKFEFKDNKVIYPRPLHSQELSKGSMPNNEKPLKGRLRKKQSLVVASRVL